jgi:hypothetical protein
MTGVGSAPAPPAEGDTNHSPHRQQFTVGLDAGVRDLLAADAGLYLHQSLSSPCLSALGRVAGCGSKILPAANTWISMATTSTIWATRIRG